MNISERLFALRDPKYQSFQASLVPTIDPGQIIGVRMPQIRSLAKELHGTAEAAVFLSVLPHCYYEENILHSVLISMIKDPAACIQSLDAFLPFVDNWAACDVISPAAFKKHPQQLPQKAREWMGSVHTYTVRYGIKALMDFYLDAAFAPEYPAWVAEIRSDEYYVNMMIAWYFATALAKQPEVCLPYLLKKRLDPWVHNKTIQKACESFRIAPEMKTELKGLRIRRPQNISQA